MNAPSANRVGPYQLLARIGQGGMGSVHLAKMDGPSGFRKLAVVKELRPDLINSPELVQLFLAEARLAARLTHPNVVHTYGADEDHGRLYIAMEYLDGQPWVRVRHRLWQNRSLPLATHLRVLSETLAALHYAHEASDYDGTPLHVVHCDVSPHNVFVTYEGQVKIVDFGVARAVTSKDVTRKDSFAGKISYAAPEQLSGEELDRRVDVFAVGVMLWEALAGRPFVEVAQDRGAVLRRRIMGNEPRVREVVPTVPRALADVCDRATACSREERFGTAAEFRHALVDYLSKNSPDTDDAQLARLVATAFREERAQVQALIERCLKATPPPTPPAARSTLPPRAPSAPPRTPSQPATGGAVQTLHGVGAVSSSGAAPALRGGADSEPIPDLTKLGPREHAGVGENTISADLSELASVSKLTDDAALVEASFTANVRRRGNLQRNPAVLGGIGLAVALFGWLVLELFSGDDQTSASGDEASKGVWLDIHVLPPESELTLDGVKLTRNPYRVRLQRDRRQHTVRATAPGRQPQQWLVTLDSDTHIAYQLPPAVKAQLNATARPAPRPVEPAFPHGAPPPAPPTASVSAPEPTEQPAPSTRRRSRAASSTASKASRPAGATPAPAETAVGASSQISIKPAPATAVPAAPAAEQEPALDERLEPTERAPRKIDEEDPYQ